MKTGIAIFYIAGKSQYLQQECYLYQMLAQMVKTVYVVCEQIETVEKALQIDREHILEGECCDRLLAYQMGYNYFKAYEDETDQVIFCDNSFFGPLFSLEKYIEEAEKRELDYWSINKYFEWLDYKYIVKSARIDTSFMCFSSKIMGSKKAEFMRDMHFFSGDLENDEEKLLKKLNECCFRGDIIIDYSRLESTNPLNHMDWLRELPFYMIKNCNCPILKKDCFRPNLLRYTNENEVMNAIKFIGNETDYDVNVIWDYLLGSYDIADIMDILKLRMIVPEKGSDRRIYEEKRCAIIMHITYRDVVDRCIEYISCIPDSIDLYITSKGECLGLIQECLKKINRKKFILLQANERGRDVSSLLVVCKEYILNYDYVCFLHDNKTRKNLGPAVIGACNMWERWESMIKSESYINNVLEAFEDNQRLGLVLAPIGYYGGTFHCLSRTWSGSYSAVCNLAERLGLNANISLEKYNCSIGTTFWCKVEALKKLFVSDITIDDFFPEPMPVDGTLAHAVERILPYVAQDAGYYTTVAESVEHAEKYISDLAFIIKNMMEKSSIPPSSYFDTYISNIDRSELENFISQNKMFYIYGNGFLAHQTSKLLEKYGVKCEAYIVSDGENRNQRKNERVINFSELRDEDKSIGIIIALGGYYQREVVPKLRQHGFNKLFFI